MSQDHITREVVTRMRKERYRRGWTAEQLADKVAQRGVDLPRNVIVNLEHGRRPSIGIDEIVALADVFTTTVNWLIYGTGVACTQCQDKPPAGFTCNDCGRSVSVRIEDVLDQKSFFTDYVAVGRG